jgi:BirA family biotin operon repressor/biotin-[acetyl-CoA-carboxylase] ligase
MTKISFIFLEKTSSTNAFMLEMPEQECAGAVVVAHEQTSGKGMGSNGWESSPGLNLTFSMGVDMSFLKAANQFLLSQAVPLGLLDVLDSILVGQTPKFASMGLLSVKWPNDLVFDGRKLCGILINSSIRGTDMGVSVIGIGLNVNQMQFKDWPTHPISLKMILGKDVELEPLLHRLVEAVDERVQLLRTEEGAAKIKNDYLQRLYRYHQWGNYETQEGRVRLYIDGLDSFGRLITIDETGNTQIFDVKELKFV